MARLLSYLSLTLVMVMSAACTVMLDWEPEGLPCSEEWLCTDGYSCRVNECVTLASVDKNDTCTDTDQCIGGHICSPEPPRICTTSCESFMTGDDCVEEYCMPVADPAIGGICIPGDGCVQGGCEPIDTCVELNDSTSVCLADCEITWDGTSATEYLDNCGSTTGDPYFCQAVGGRDKEQMVCLASNTQAQNDGSNCNNGSQPCKNGSGCVGNFCRQYCNLALNTSTSEQVNPGCEADELCCALTGLWRGLEDGDVGYCNKDCGGD